MSWMNEGVGHLIAIGSFSLLVLAMFVIVSVRIRGRKPFQRALITALLVFALGLVIATFGAMLGARIEWLWVVPLALTIAVFWFVLEYLRLRLLGAIRNLSRRHESKISGTRVRGILDELRKYNSEERDRPL